MSTKEEIKRFALVTPFVGLTDFGVYYLCLKLMPIPAAKAVSFVCAAVFGYLLNKYITFVKPKRSGWEVVRYLAVQFFLLGFNVCANGLILWIAPRAIVQALVTASVLTACVSFIAKKWWVFKT